MWQHKLCIRDRFEEQLFERIKEVQTQYNCKIKILNSPYPDLNTIKTYVLALSLIHI